MKRKVLIALLSGVCATACAASLAGCDLFGGTATNVTEDGIKYELTNDNTYCAVGFENANDNRQTLTIPEKVKDVSVTGIGSLAFEGSTSLKTVSVPAGVKDVDAGAFKGCTAIESLTLPYVGGRDDGWSIGYNFSEDANAENKDVAPANLKSVTILSQTRLRGGDFKDCTALESVNLPNTLAYVGRYVFENCTSLKEVVIPDSVTRMEYAFEGCTSLEKLTVPFVGEYKNIADYTETTRSNFGYFFDGSSYNGGVPESLKTVTVTSATELHDEAFKDSKHIEKIELPATLTDMGKRTFMGCTALESINIPVKVTELSSAVFNGCENLEISLHEKVATIGAEAFKNCTNLKIELTEGLQYINYEAFENCTNLEVSIPTTVTFIGSGAFNGCEKSVKEEDGLSYVGKWLVGGNVETANVKDGTIGIAGYAFTASLKTVTIPESVRYFCGGAFKLCSFIRVQYNGSLASWFDIQFGDRTANPLNNSYNLYLLNEGEYVTALTVYDNEYEDTLEIPEGVTKIGEYALVYFYNLKAVYIPRSVTEMGYLALGCQKLKDIIYGGTRAEWAAINKDGEISAAEFTVHCTDGIIDFSTD